MTQNGVDSTYLEGKLRIYVKSKVVRTRKSNIYERRFVRKAYNECPAA